VTARNVDVWLPSDYNPNKKYGVIYMHDGQNLFDGNSTWNHQEWGIDESVAAYNSSIPSIKKNQTDSSNSDLSPKTEYIVVGHLGYGTPTTIGHEKIEVSEGWADCIGHTCANWRYPSTGILSTPLNYGRANWIEKIERFTPRPNQYPFDGGGTMFDMTETGEPAATTIQDEVNAYTLSEIFAALPTSITSVQGFHALVLSQNSNKQQTAVDLLFTSYGF
jgi:hypothetical protein